MRISAGLLAGLAPTNLQNVYHAPRRWRRQPSQLPLNHRPPPPPPPPVFYDPDPGDFIELSDNLQRLAREHRSAPLITLATGTRSAMPNGGRWPGGRPGPGGGHDLDANGGGGGEEEEDEFAGGPQGLDEWELVPPAGMNAGVRD